METRTDRQGIFVGKLQSVRTPEIEEAALEEIEEHPETSTREIARKYIIYHQITWRFFVNSLPYFKSLGIMSH